MNIEYLCSLDHLRDVRENGAVIKKGIIDEMVRESYELKRMSIPHRTKFKGGKKIEDPQCPGYFEPKAKRDKILAGHYIKPIKGNGWQGYFEMCGYKNKKYYSNEDWEDTMSEGRLIGLENLIALSEGKLNNKLRKNFNFEVNCVDDFKAMLRDEGLSENIRRYLVNMVKYKNLREIQKGTHTECYSTKTMKDGVLTIEYTRKIGVSLDAPKEYSDEGKVTTYYDYLEDTLEDEEEEIDYDTIFKYINEIKEDILTDKQLDYIKRKANGEHFNPQVSCEYKKRIQNAIIEYLNKSKYAFKTNFGWLIKQDIITTLEDILKQNTEKQSFEKLCYYLSLDNKCETALIDLLHQLTFKDYDPIFYHIRFGSDEKYLKTYLKSNFMNVIEKLQREYNWQQQNQIKIYNYNKCGTERKMDKIKDLIESRVIKENGEGNISMKKNPIEGVLCMTEVIELYEKLFNKKCRFKELMNELGYEVKKTRLKGIHCYKVIK